MNNTFLICHGIEIKGINFGFFHQSIALKGNQTHVEDKEMGFKFGDKP